jgi:hypothetical protein
LAPVQGLSADDIPKIQEQLTQIKSNQTDYGLQQTQSDQMHKVSLV